MSNTSKKASVSKPWLKYFPEESIGMELPKCTAYGYMKQQNADRIDSVAMRYYGNNITYRQFFDRVDECANAFAALGVKPGEIVSLLTVSVPETIFTIYALNKLGATANAIDPRMDIDSIRRMVQECNSRILVVLDIAFPKVLRIRDDIDQEHIIVQPFTRSLPPLKALYKKLTTKTNVTYGGNIIKWDEFISKGKGVVAEEAPYVGDAVVAITYTGGTTGLPKGVMLTNDSLNAVVINFEYCGIYFKPGDKFLGIIPVFSSYGLVCGMHMPMCLGVSVILIPAFQPPTIGKLVRDFKPEHMISVPAFYEIMMECKELKGKDLSWLVTLGSGGDTMNEGLEERLKTFMAEHNIKYPLAQGYGMSELSAAASFCVNKIYKPLSVGIPSLTTTIAIFDPETGEELDIGEMGEICVTGPSMMKGYFKRQEETDNIMRLHDDGQMWIHSGDIGYLDEDGFLFIKGRVKRMICRFDGHKVFPVNMESMVMEHEKIRNCCVIAIRDREHGQGDYPFVTIMVTDETVDKAALCDEIYEMCQTRCEERGRPVGVIAVDKIPLTGMGKNDYRALEKEYYNFDYTQLHKK